MVVEGRGSWSMLTCQSWLGGCCVDCVCAVDEVDDVDEAIGKALALVITLMCRRGC